jgi:hypothetical protein
MSIAPSCLSARASMSWAAIAVMMVCVCWWRLRVAHDQVDAAMLQAGSIARDIQRVESLRGQGRTLSGGRRPDADLVTRAQRALAAVGLPINVCSGVQPRAQQTVSGSGVQVQTVQLSLRGLSPGDLGAWLNAWNTANQPWQIGELQLTHQIQPAAGSRTADLDSNRFDVSVVVSAPYLEDAP